MSLLYVFATAFNQYTLDDDDDDDDYDDDDDDTL